ncbi:MAG: hypothetical protein GC145_03030 [Caulobacter sp.]|nr:hypothetical protein [Caulobacter sp.]
MLDTLVGESGLDVKAERFPMMFQLCEQLDQALAEVARRAGWDDWVHHSQSLRQRTMDMAKDQMGHARSIVDELSTKLKLAPKALPDDKLLRVFTKASLDHLLKDFSDQEEKGKERTPGWSDGLLKIGHQISARLSPRDGHPGDAGQETQYILPTERFFIGVIGQLLRSSAATKANGWVQTYLCDAAEAGEGEGGRAGTVNARPPIPRKALSPARRDPLLHLLERLGINRFITTNYDHEIERLFGDLEYRQDGHGSARSDDHSSLLRPRAERIVFHGHNASHLMTFAVRDRERRAAVVYLHGKAGREEDGADIIVTETDYQRQYLSPGDHRDIADDAISMAFGGNPILFVGSNVGEDDLLRPLRQFMSTPSRVGDRIAIALIPAMAERRKTYEEKIALLGRYGVYSIHFGIAAFDAASPIRRQPGGGWTIAEAERHSFEWLPWALGLKNQLLEFIAAIGNVNKSLNAKDQTGGDASLEELSNGLTEVLRIRADIVAKIEKGPKWTMAAERAKADRPDRPWRSDEGVLAPPDCLECIHEEVSEGLSIGGDVEIINTVLRWSKAVIEEIKKFEIHDHRRSGDLAAHLKNFNRKTKPNISSLFKKVAKEGDVAKSVLEGSTDSMLAIFTCARLMRARWQWDDWKTDWFKLPNPRPPVFSQAPRSEEGTADQGRAIYGQVESWYEGMRFEHRHKIQRPDSPQKEASDGRFYNGAPAQTFYNLVGALSKDSDEAERYRNARGRRVLTIAGRRGVGKGHFFNVLESIGVAAEDLGSGKKVSPKFYQFLKALGPDQKWAAAGFYNLSFGHEVMSVFDGIADFLHRNRPKVADASQAVTDLMNSDFQSLNRDRTRTLEAALTEWTQAASEWESVVRDKRVLIAVNFIGMLFDHKGNPKNGQVKRLFNLLIDERFASAPIDIVLVCQDTNLPSIFRGGAGREGIRPLILHRPTNNSKSRLQGEQYYEAMGVELDRPNAIRPTGRVVDLDWRPPAEKRLADPWRSSTVTISDKKGVMPPVSSVMAIHVLHETRASVITTAYFPRIALLLARHALLTGGGKLGTWVEKFYDRDHDGGLPDIFDLHAPGFRNRVRLMLNELRPDGLWNGVPGLPPSQLFSPSIVLLWLLLEVGQVSADEGNLESRFEGLIKDLREQSGPTAASVDEETIARILTPVMGTLGSADLNGQCEDILEAIRAYEGRMKELHKAVGGSRILLTLLMAGAHEITTDLAKEAGEAEKKTTVPRRAVADIGARIDRYLERAVLALVGVPQQRISDIVIDLVLSLFRRHHEQGKILPLKILVPTEGKAGPGEMKYEPSDVSSTAQFNLMMEVIWHISVIGQPVEVDVLAWCPRIQEACHKLRPGEAFTTQDYRQCVREVLKLAVNRCLAFRLSPDGKSSQSERDATREGEVGYDGHQRYAVHHLVQRFVFEKLGAPSVEFTDADQFTLSLFATQPDDLPRLTHDAHRKLSDLIEALSGYPGADENASRFKAEQDASLRQRLLRAAYGIMRAVYSVAVLARFNDAGADENGSPGHEGYFEQHRRRVRWLIRAGVEYDRWLKTMEAEVPRPPRLENAAPPFYAEEIVWLYNECAVLSLVQGKLSDAQALLEAALRAAKRIEPDETGALHVRLLLNKAVVDIERGHGFQAKEYLTRIVDMVGEHPVPPMIAEGYLGLISHLAGEVDAALARYERAIRDLSAVGRSRAASIFSRHRGDLLRNLQTPRVEEARQSIKTLFTWRRPAPMKTSGTWRFCRWSSIALIMLDQASVRTFTYSWMKSSATREMSECRVLSARQTCCERLCCCLRAKPDWRALWSLKA